jgi:hypothetical protein
VFRPLLAEAWVPHRCLIPYGGLLAPCIIITITHTQNHSCDTHTLRNTLSPGTCCILSTHRTLISGNPMLPFAGRRPCLIPWISRNHPQITSGSPSRLAPKQPLRIIRSSALSCTTRTKCEIPSSSPRWITPSALTDDAHNSSTPKAPDVRRRALCIARRSLTARHSVHHLFALVGLTDDTHHIDYPSVAPRRSYRCDSAPSTQPGPRDNSAVVVVSS